MHVRKVFLISLCLCISLLYASAGDAESVLRESSLLGNLNHVQYSVEMVIEQVKGEKSRSLEIYRSEDDGEEKFLVQIVQPAFLKNMKLLSIRSDENHARWLKTSRGVKRLSSSSRDDQPLFDSDFSTSDLLQMDFDAYDFTFLENGDDAVVIRALSVDGKDERLITVDTASSLIIKVDYLSGDGSVRKQYEVLETQSIGTESIPLTCTMKQIAEGTQTILSFDSVILKDSIPARYFNSSQL